MTVQRPHTLFRPRKILPYPRQRLFLGRAGVTFQPNQAIVAQLVQFLRDIGEVDLARAGFLTGRAVTHVEGGVEAVVFLHPPDQVAGGPLR